MGKKRIIMFIPFLNGKKYFSNIIQIPKTKFVPPTDNVCASDSDCQSSDANKKCSSGSCVCKSGYYSDISGTCIAGEYDYL